jgi:hypothetical protein
MVNERFDSDSQLLAQRTAVAHAQVRDHAVAVEDVMTRKADYFVTDRAQTAAYRTALSGLLADGTFPCHPFGCTPTVVLLSLSPSFCIFEGAEYCFDHFRSEPRPSN